MKEYIQKQLPVEELLCQLAEEGTELAHAALKYRRALDGTNPTPVTPSEALANLKEEIADVMLLMNILGLDTPKVSGEYIQIMLAKEERWVKRLKESRMDAPSPKRQEDAPCTKRTPKEPWQDCHNCGNYETKAGCDVCVSAADNGRRISIPSMWKPKEDAE